MVGQRAWSLLRDTLVSFFADDALSRGAAIAYYTIFSIAPILLIATSVAGLVFGYQAAQGAIVQQLSGLMGHNSAATLQALLQGARFKGTSIFATIIGVITLGLTATGVFTELQTGLNVIWRAQPKGSVTGALLRARLLSLGLLAALGFLLLVSLIISAGLDAVSAYLSARWEGVVPMLRAISAGMSFVLITVLFAAIYKVLPDCEIDWADVVIGAIATSLLFVAGKFLISLYISRSAVASSYGSAGSLLVILLWIYYSAQIFLLGAEFTRVFADQRRQRRSRRTSPLPGTTSLPPDAAPPRQSGAPVPPRSR